MRGNCARLASERPSEGTDVERHGVSFDRGSGGDWLASHGFLAAR